MAQFNLTITLEYNVILHNDLGQLITEVNQRIGEGWQPLGGLAVTENDDNWAGRTFYQAMAREKPEKQYKYDPDLRLNL